MILNHIKFVVYNLLTFTVLVYCHSRDYYDILNIPRTAKHNHIKSAFRKMAKQLHPDKNRDDPQATEKFSQLRNAYEVLSDDRLRKDYDRCGEKCVKKDSMANGHDPFASFFGDFGFQFDDSPAQKETPKGGTIVLELGVSLEELYNGNFVQITRNKPVIKPASGTRQCNCRQEMITKQLGPGRFQMMQQNVCDECPNIVMITEESMLEIEIEPGMRNGQETKFIAEGEPHIDGDPGDLVFKIKTFPHKIFERRGDDLYTNLTISLQDALVGFKTEIPHLDGRKIVIERDVITWPGAKIRKKGLGMPNYENNNMHGYLIITLDIQFPKNNLTEQDKEDLKKILSQSSVNKLYNGLDGY
ncbi:DnaJ domain,Chaperone DnaJ, C-terminal,DnaJ domain, conserved site,HSP40/DnaJ peptide-binding [Cinara cedri]|uniref:DnaJ domain,Chaperone DnaJ, C-terminal,DnaJ domain, conserved site,HSP40/DnaJ peptide-binding n=1 Tax=Cinara cedri TaxID=506608 RepID=A0A5E4MNG8_9HEMI|nr:DnaJ domain,Chaperone DnaJ, C-terminal,DnaJ domain, conserved site,HSP40/DnaJ peptide-binding [Cinara cedri]